MKISSREVFRFSERCFRAAGLPKGSAAANAKAIWWAEVYRGTGLVTLHSLLEDVDSLDRTQLEMQDRTSRFSVIKSNDQPGVVSSTAALDIGCSLAKQAGIGIVSSTLPETDHSLPTIGHTVYNAAERGLISLLLYSHNEEGSATILGVPDQPHPVVAETELERPSESYTKLSNLIDAGIHHQRHEPLIQAFFDGNEEYSSSSTDARMVEKLLTNAMETTQGTKYGRNSSYLTICIDPRHPRHSGGVRRIAERFIEQREATSMNVFSPEEIQQRGKVLIEDGVDVEETIWEDIFDYSTGVLAPESVDTTVSAGPDMED